MEMSGSSLKGTRGHGNTRGKQLKNMCSAGQRGFTNMKFRTKVEIKPRTKVLTPSNSNKSVIKVEDKYNAKKSGGCSTSSTILKLVKFRFQQ